MKPAGSAAVQATEGEEPLVTNDSVGWMFAPALPRRAKCHRRLESTAEARRVADFPARFLPASRRSIEGRDIGLGVGRQVDLCAWRLAQHPARASDWWRGVVIAVVPFKSVASCDLTDGRSGLVLVCNVTEVVSDVWMMENFDPDLPMPHQTA